MNPRFRIGVLHLLIFPTKMANLQLVVTADGSKTIFNPEVGENYHSRHGALQESRHVFLKSGLAFFLERTRKTTADVLEVGFGTGLNFLLSADFCTANKNRLNYTGIEAYPLGSDMIEATGYSAVVDASLYTTFLEQYPVSLQETVNLNEFCTLEIFADKLENFTTEKMFDVIFFDAFAAVHQPEMWTTESIKRCCDYLRPGGIFVTYAITGNLKRCMKSLGFTIEKAPGAPGKREMLRAIKT